MRKRKIPTTEYECIVYNYKALYPQVKMAKRYGVSAELIRKIIWANTTPSERETVKAKLKELSHERYKKRMREKYAKNIEMSRAKGREYYRKRHGVDGRTDYWTEKEDAIIRKYYPEHRMSEVVAKLNNRTRGAMVQRANRLKVKKTKRASSKKICNYRS